MVQTRRRTYVIEDVVMVDAEPEQELDAEDSEEMVVGEAAGISGSVDSVPPPQALSVSADVQQDSNHPDSQEPDDNGTTAGVSATPIVTKHVRFVTPKFHSDVESPEPEDDEWGLQLNQTTKLQKLLKWYHDAYFHSDCTVKSHLPRAKYLALTLLQHYYPASQGFHVEETDLHPMAQYPWVIQFRDYYKDGFHQIPKELIAGFVVKRERALLEAERSGSKDQVTQTVLGIMVDDLSTMNKWASILSSDNHNADLLSTELACKGRVRKGTGILIVGPLIEFYEFDDNRPPPKTPKTSNENIPFMPWGKLMRKANYQFRMDRSNLSAIDSVFRAVAGTTIQYEDETESVGATAPEDGSEEQVRLYEQRRNSTHSIPDVFQIMIPATSEGADEASEDSVVSTKSTAPKRGNRRKKGGGARRRR